MCDPYDCALPTSADAVTSYFDLRNVKILNAQNKLNLVQATNCYSWRLLSDMTRDPKAAGPRYMWGPKAAFIEAN